MSWMINIQFPEQLEFFSLLASQNQPWSPHSFLIGDCRRLFREYV